MHWVQCGMRAFDVAYHAPSTLDGDNVRAAFESALHLRSSYLPQDKVREEPTVRLLAIACFHTSSLQFCCLDTHCWTPIA